MEKTKNDKKKILEEIDEVLGEDKTKEVLAFLKKHRQEVIEAYKENLQKQNETSGQIDDLSTIFVLKLDKLIQLGEIANNKDLQRVEIVNQVIPPSEVSVKNLAEINIPSVVKVAKPIWLEEFITIINSTLFEPFKDFLRKQFGLFETHTSPKNPLAVRLSDGEKFLDNLTKMVGYLQQPAPVGLDKEARDLLLGIIDAIENIEIDINVENLNISLEDLEELNGSNLINKYYTDNLEVDNEDSDTLIIYSVPAGFNLMLKGIWVEGNGDGVFTLIEGEVPIWKGRNAWTRRSFTEAFEYLAPEGTDLGLIVANPNHQPNNYNGGFWGYLIKV